VISCIQRDSRIKRITSFVQRLKKIGHILRKTFYRWERLVVLLLRGRLFLLIGQFVRQRGTLSVVIFFALFVVVGNISAKTKENRFLKGYWNSGDVAQKERQNTADTQHAGLALGDDTTTGTEQLNASHDSSEATQATNLGVLHATDEGLLADAASDTSQYTGTDYDEGQNSKTTIYTVQPGDTVESIARKHKLTTDTLLWANELDDPNDISPGDTLLLLSVSGVQYKVKPGDTVESIAKKFEADPHDIIVFNDLPANGELAVGTTITIPGGIKKQPKPKPQPKTIIARRTYTSVAVQTATTRKAGYFSRPIRGGVRSQGIHPTNAVDLAAPIGTPIYAAAPGTVVIARYGWNGGYGNYVVIAHPNGTKTLYGHMRAGGLRVKAKQKVKRGQLIGLMGSTGRSTGPHVHFEVHGARNPF